MALWSDVRFALRQLRKSPGFTFVVMGTLALCIGVNTAVFSVLDAVLLRAAPYPEPDRLALVVTAVRGGGAEEIDNSQTGAQLEAVRDRVAGLDVAANAGPGGANFAAGMGPEYIQQQRVSAGYFRVLGVAPLTGREFSRAEDVPEGVAVAVLSHGFWQRAFHGDAGVLGRTISLRGEEYTVVGIMPREFRGAAPVDVWTPLRPSRRGEGGGSNYEVIARLRPGVSWAQASEQLRSLSQALNADPAFPREAKNFEERIIPLKTGATEDVRSELLLTWAAVLMVLLIGCVNIAGLLLARSGARGREMATRMALGGSRGAIVRQLLMESLLLALGGGIAGIGVGGFALDWLKQLGADKAQIWHPIELDARVLGVMLGMAVLTSLLFGLAPAVHTSRLDIRGVLNEAGRGIAGGRRRWTRGALVAAEVALSLVLLIGAGLMVRTLVWLNGLHPGFDPHNVIAAEASMQDARYQTAAAVNRLYTQTLERMRRIPGVQSAAVALTLPYERPLNNGFRTVEGTDQNPHSGEFVYATPSYFETMRIAVIAGRAFGDSDTPQRTRVVVVSESFAKKYFHGDALGRHLKLGKEAGEIIGICGDVQQHSGLSGAQGPLSVEFRETGPHVVLAEMGGAHRRSAGQPPREDWRRGGRSGSAVAGRALPHDGRVAQRAYGQPAVPGGAVLDSGGTGCVAGRDRALRTDLAIDYAAAARDRDPAGAGGHGAADHRRRHASRDRALAGRGWRGPRAIAGCGAIPALDAVGRAPDRPGYLRGHGGDSAGGGRAGESGARAAHSARGPRRDAAQRVGTNEVSLREGKPEKKSPSCARIARLKPAPPRTTRNQRDTEGFPGAGS